MDHSQQHHLEQQEELNFRQVLHPSGGIVLVPIEKVVLSQTLYVHNAKTTCRYASKRCTNPRTTKRNGELHSFCEWHRAKANQNQRRLESKKKLMQRGGKSGGSSGDNSGASSPIKLSVPEHHPASPLSFTSKLGSSHMITSHEAYQDMEDDEEEYDQDGEEWYSPDQLEPIGMHDQQAWAASHQYYLHHQQQQQHQAMGYPPHLNSNGSSSYNGYRGQPHQQQQRVYPQYQPLNNPLMDWELGGDLVGSSVAYAQTLNL